MSPTMNPSNKLAKPINSIQNNIFSVKNEMHKIKKKNLYENKLPTYFIET